MPAKSAAKHRRRLPRALSASSETLHSELLELAHDAIIVRDVDSTILFWNRGAQETYGWSAAEACGNVTPQFLKTEFPEPLDQVYEKLYSVGSWEGELVHWTKEGKRLVVASRQVLERD